MKIGIAFDLVPVDRAADGPDDRYEEFDKPETVSAIAEVIRGAGHDVVLLGDGREFVEKALGDPPDFVFNLAEGHGVGRSREARVPAVCELLGIPCSGSDPLTLAAALDKDVAKRLVSTFGVPTPHGFVYRPDPRGFVTGPEYARSPARFPVIIKPACEGSSKGIRGVCLANDRKEAAEICDRLAREYQQPILVEQFIAGDELTVGVIGNGADAEVIGAMRILPKQRTDRFVYSLEVKRDWRNRVDYEAPARLPEALDHRLKSLAHLVYVALGCRDVARIDFRLRDGIPYFIEANPLPGLAPVTSDLVILAEGHGLGHAALIRRILDASLVRVGLARLPAVES